MKEIGQILARCDSHQALLPEFALATVVRVEGSAYRRAGARMLIGDLGVLEGSVSGGCLERDVVLRARAALANQRSTVIRYDSLDEEDEPRSGFQLGCQGVIDILIEPLSTEASQTELSFLRKFVRDRKPCLLAKIIRIEGKSPLSVGTCLFLDSERTLHFVQSRSSFDEEIILDANEILRTLKSRRRLYRGIQSEVEVFFEVLKPPTSLILFGVGPDVPPIVRIARELGFEITVVDCRGTYLFPGKFQDVDQTLSCRPDAILNRLPLGEDSVVVVMTHNYPLDLQILRTLRECSFAYLGVLGPRKRGEQLLRDLGNEDRGFSQAQIEKFHAPAGLDIGATTPELIALSILSEVQGVLSQRRGGFLRDRNGPIYEREAN